jgi:urease accessory protein UreH
MPKFFTDEKGRWVGSVTESGGKKTYLDGTGKLVARVRNNSTNHLLTLLATINADLASNLLMVR